MFEPSASARRPAGFRKDTRFSAPAAPETPPPPDLQPADPVALAFTQGFEAGVTEALAAAAQKAQAESTARDALALTLTQLDDALAEKLRLRLRDTVAALCEAAIAPLALDQAALMARIERAVGMLARADDERVIRLHPEDMAFLSAQMHEDWHIQPDPALERGALRIESANGGVEDGPAQWRAAIAEAVHQC
jgi:flagellar assembly protein FliH